MGVVGLAGRLGEFAFQLPGSEGFDMAVKEGEIGAVIVTEMEAAVLVRVSGIKVVELIALVAESTIVEDRVNQQHVFRRPSHVKRGVKRGITIRLPRVAVFAFIGRPE